MAKYKFRGRSILFFVYMIPMIVSIAGTASSTLNLFEKLGFDEMPFVGIALMSASGMGLSFLLTHAVFKSTSDTYMEAARIDGA
jgi:ABC-type glycerol-3-phosphate transport system permease component